MTKAVLKMIQVDFRGIKVVFPVIQAIKAVFHVTQVAGIVRAERQIVRIPQPLERHSTLLAPEASPTFGEAPEAYQLICSWMKYSERKNVNIQQTNSEK